MGSPQCRNLFAKTAPRQKEPAPRGCSRWQGRKSTGKTMPRRAHCVKWHSQHPQVAKTRLGTNALGRLICAVFLGTSGRRELRSLACEATETVGENPLPNPHDCSPQFPAGLPRIHTEGTEITETDRKERRVRIRIQNPFFPASVALYY